ncbi:GMC oxidoreductase [Hypoxylon sp. EC38]|nr:GMC oxidoreductase [Hypoxylon sp. EC38]
MAPRTIFGAVTASLAGVASATVGAGILNVGNERITQIFGNHFGRAGHNASYDYIVVGGGTAGNTIAARLAMDPANYTVAVLNAGSFYEIMNGNLTQIPGYSFESAEPNFASGLSSMTALGLRTVPQPGYNNRQIDYIVGQVFGGGSAANTGGYHRPTKGTYDWWAEIVEDDYWRWDNVYNFAKRSCNFTPPDYTRIDPSLNIWYDEDAYIPDGGPLHVSYGNWQGPYGPPLGEALAKMGFEYLPGLNSGRLIGYGTATGAVDTSTATRDSSETSFLQAAARANPEFKIYPDALVQRVLFDENKKANGVLVQGNALNNPVTFQLNATREVIISGGVWFSPQLLMLSGIGPAETLQQYGIDVLVDSPGVGQNEWDSPYLSTVFKVNITTSTQLAAGNPEVVAEAIYNWTYHQSGRLSSIGTGQALSFEKYPEHLRSSFTNETLEWLSTFPEDWPEVEFLPLEVSSFPEDIGPDDYYITIGSALLSTSSIGNVTIQSNDAKDWPVINPNWLHDIGDQQMAVASVKRAREIAFNTTFVTEEYIPGPDVQTDEEILEWVRNNSNLIYHGSTTCKMGRDSDPMAVLDSRARVRGVTGLRVVDTSAYPNLVPGHTMGSVYLFAEAIANSILTGN